MKPYLKTVYNEVREVVDSETGELIEVSSKQQKIVVETEKEFFFVFASILKALNEDTIDTKVLAYIMFKCINSDGEFINGPFLKGKVTKALGISLSSYSRALRSLTKAGICLRAPNRGTYQINPEYVWKGNTTTRKKRLQLILENRNE